MKVQASVRTIVALLAWWAAASSATAQGDPGSLERTIPQIQISPLVEERAISAPIVPLEGSHSVDGSFVLGAVNIQGSTVFSSAELAQSFEPMLAGRIGKAELGRIAADITDRYRRAGYLLSYAMLPEQLVQSGIVEVRVVEGFIDEVRVESGGASAEAVRALADKLRSERPLRASTLERILGLARDTPGVTVTDTRISRSPGDPSRHQLTIVLGSDRVRAFTYTDNRGTIDGARLRAFSSVSIPSLAIPGSQLQIDLFTIPARDFRYHYGQAKVALPLQTDGLRLSASVSRGDQFRRLEGVDQNGRSQLLTAELAYPFWRSRAFSLAGHVSISDWKSEEKRAGAIVQRDRIQVARAWLDVTSVTSARINGRIEVSRGLDLTSSADAGDPPASRPDASASFTKLSVDMQLVAPVAKNTILRLETTAQLSTKPLLAFEEFSLGGSRIGRSFDFNEVSGDHGIGAMAELAYKLPTKKRGSAAPELFAYVDGGGAFRKRPLAGEPKEMWLASAGAGTRLSVLGLRLSAEVGVPIARSNADRGVRAFVSIMKIL